MRARSCIELSICARTRSSIGVVRQQADGARAAPAAHLLHSVRWSTYVTHIQWHAPTYTCPCPSAHCTLIQLAFLQISTLARPLTPPFCIWSYCTCIFCKFHHTFFTIHDNYYDKYKIYKYLKVFALDSTLRESFRVAVYWSTYLPNIHTLRHNYTNLQTFPFTKLVSSLYKRFF